METQITYSLTREDLKIVMDEVMRNKFEDALINKFSCSYVSVQAASEIHNVGRKTVMRYYEEGYLSAAPERGKRNALMFRLSDVLRWDFVQMKNLRKAKYEFE